MPLGRSAPRFQCLYEAARQRAARLPRRSATRSYSNVPYSTAAHRSSPLQRHSKSSPLELLRICNLPKPLRFSTSTPRHAPPKTVQQAKSRYMIGPVSVLSVGLFVGAGVGLYFYFQYEKARMERKRIADASKGVGKPKVGGAFELVDQEGRLWSSENMKGKFSLVYFGFSHCPDICPEELDKMASMLSQVTEKLPPSSPLNPELLPVFITCDPARDSPAVLKQYLREFHQDFIGLTGNWEAIKAVCKLYRVYFSTPKAVTPDMDYLVDHSIYFYLMDPEGDFVEAIGRQHTAEQGANLIMQHMGDWKGSIKKG